MSGGPGARSGARRRLVLLAAVAATAGLAAATLALRSVGQAPPYSGTASPPAVPTDRLAPVHPPRQLPELHFVRGDGREMSLGDFRGRAVLLNFWATWCVPCRVEMPALDRLQAAFGGADFEVVALSIDRGGPSAVQAFYREVGLTALRPYIDPIGAASRELGAVGIPTTLLIDRNGREVAWRIGPAEWDSPEMIRAIRRHLGLPEASEVEDVTSAARR